MVQWLRLLAPTAGDLGSIPGRGTTGPQGLLKSGPGHRGRSACGTTHVVRLEFPRETGLGPLIVNYCTKKKRLRQACMVPLCFGWEWL